MNNISPAVYNKIDVDPEWDHFKDGFYCADPPSKGKKVLSKDVKTGKECMSLGDAASKKYVSFMMKANNDIAGRHCFGYDSCTFNSDSKNSNYKTYTRRNFTGNF